MRPRPSLREPPRPLWHPSRSSCAPPHHSSGLCPSFSLSGDMISGMSKTYTVEHYRTRGSAEIAPLLLLLALEAGNEHLLGPLGRPEVVLQNAVEELHQFLVALLLGVLDVGLQGLRVIRGLVEHGDEVVVLVLGLPGQVGHLFLPPS